MIIKLSSVIGFCDGVNYACNKAYYVLERAQKENKRAYCIGSLVHNPLVIEQFQNRGLVFVKEPSMESGLALISAHGLDSSVRAEFEKKGYEIVDGTCPRVARNCKTVLDYYAKGYKILILGMKGHSETNTLLGLGVPCTLIEKLEDLESLDSFDSGDRVCLVAQTTVLRSLFLEVSKAVRQRFSDYVVVNSLCPSPLSRQKAVRDLAKECDVVLILGGHKSANTKSLVIEVEAMGKKAFMLENLHEIPSEVLKYEVVGIAGGASTPIQFIYEVKEELEYLCSIQ